MHWPSSLQVTADRPLPLRGGAARASIAFVRVVVTLVVLAAAPASAQPGASDAAPPSETTAPSAPAPAAVPAGDRPSDAAPSDGAATRPINEPLARREPELPTEPKPLFRYCFPMYAEGHLLIGGRTGPENVPEAVITRWSIGVRVCTEVDIQAGLVWDRGIDIGNAHANYGAFGGEARVILRLPNQLRVGPHFAIMKQEGRGDLIGASKKTAIWVGARLERDPVVVGLDVLRIPDGERNAPYDVWGLYGSVGLRGWPGLIGFAAVTLLYVGNFVANEHAD